jgi:two-component system, LytTR family, response regulator
MERRIRTLIADDEALARQRIRALLATDAEIDIVADCEDGARAAALVRKHDIELLFLDIRMPRMDGFEVLEALAGRAPPVVVFVTAYDDHAVRAFEVHAFDYLLKPFDRARFRDTLERAKRQVRMRDVADVAARLGEMLRAIEPGAAAQARVPVRSQGRVRFVEASDIVSAEADDDVVHLHIGDEIVTTRETLTRLAERLPASFVRVHRSWIINAARIREVQPWFGGDHVIIMSDGSRVVTGRTYRDRLRALLP